MRDADLLEIGDHLLTANLKRELHCNGVDRLRQRHAERHASPVPARIILRRPTPAGNRTIAHRGLRREAVLERGEIDIAFERRAWLAIGMARAVELALPVVLTADHGAHSAVRLHRDESALVEVPGLAGLLDSVLDGVLGGLLQAEIDRSAGNEDVIRLSVHDALHFLERPIEEIVRRVRLAALDDLGWIHAGPVNLALAHEA